MIVFSILALALGFFAGHTLKKTTVVNSLSLREKNDDYKFIDPLLVVNRANLADPSPVFTALYNSVNKYVSDQKSNGLMNASVYFIKYGDKGGSFYINKDEVYSPASLLKVAIMIAYLKLSESKPYILDEEITYSANLAGNFERVPFEDPTKLKEGDDYVVNDLINKMIIDSDNGAMNILIRNIDISYLNKVYTDLGLKNPSVDNADYKMSAFDYSLFLRVLYNSTYLSREDSEKALAILSKSTFQDGLRAGLPENIAVAHKFGEHVNGVKDTIESVELHDCGYVYLPNDTYFLCVMSKGKSLKTLSETISHISKVIYENVASN